MHLGVLFLWKERFFSVLILTANNNENKQIILLTIGIDLLPSGMNVVLQEICFVYFESN